MRGRGSWATGAVAAVLLATAWVESASAATTVTATDDLFDAPSYSIAQGEKLFLQNNGVRRHDVSAVQDAPFGNTQLFESSLIGTGSDVVDGTEYLTAGSYPFVCTLHSNMQATLEVGAAGAPVPRPKVKIRLPGAKRSRLAATGKLRLVLSSPIEALTTVSAGSAAQPVETTVRAGGTETVTLKLTRKFRAKLKAGKQKVKVAALPRFGVPSVTSKVLK